MEDLGYKLKHKTDVKATIQTSYGFYQEINSNIKSRGSLFKQMQEDDNLQELHKEKKDRINKLEKKYYTSSNKQ